MTKWLVQSTVGIKQDSDLRLFLLITAMDVISGDIGKGPSWEPLSADDSVLMTASEEEALTAKVKEQKKRMEINGTEVEYY